MDLFKLFYNHDQRLDNLSRNGNKTSKNDTKSSLEDFMSPTPTYSSFYLMGTRFPDEKIGLNRLDKLDQIIGCLSSIFKNHIILSPTGKYSDFDESICQMPTGAGVIISNENMENVAQNSFNPLEDLDSGMRNEQLKELLAAGNKVLFKEEARDGYDLYLYSKENIYPQLFSPFQEIIDDSFRFFSINSKRMRSEKHYYFDIWTLDKPPHGAEEVFGDTILRSKKPEDSR